MGSSHQPSSKSSRRLPRVPDRARRSGVEGHLAGGATQAEGTDREPSSAEREMSTRILGGIKNELHSRLTNLLFTRPGLGVAEMAEYTGLSVSKVRREIAALMAEGLIEVDREEPRRGVVKRYYVGADRLWIDTEEDELLSEQDRQLTSLTVVRRILEEARRGVASGVATQRSDRMLANTAAEVDEQGWRELSELHHQLLERTLEVIAESRLRLAAGEDPPLTIASGQILFEVPPPGKGPKL